jgi:hypothetical protein
LPNLSAPLVNCPERTALVGAASLYRLQSGPASLASGDCGWRLTGEGSILFSFETDFAGGCRPGPRDRGAGAGVGGAKKISASQLQSREPLFKELSNLSAPVVNRRRTRPPPGVVLPVQGRRGSSRTSGLRDRRKMAYFNPRGLLYGPGPQAHPEGARQLD